MERISFSVKKDLSYANLVRRALINEIPVYCIGYAIFHVNQSSRKDEIIAQRLGLLPLNNKNYVHSDNKIRVNVTGPLDFTSKHIPLPFAQETPILTLREGERLIMDLIVTQGTGKDHVKWQPVASVSLRETEDACILSYYNLGILDDATLQNSALNLTEKAAALPPTTIFNKLI